MCPRPFASPNDPGAGAAVPGPSLPAWPPLRRLPRLLFEPTGASDDFDGVAVDCPKVLPHRDGYLMAYAGWDGRANRIGLAWSEDLLHWRRLGLALDLGPSGEWDAGSVSGPCLCRIGGRLALLYCGFPRIGYEAGPGRIGLAWCTKEPSATDAGRWEKEGAPLLSPEDGAAWERGGLYQSFLLEHDEEYWLFYNAKNRTEGAWHEQIGAARSRDLKRWERAADRPVLPVSADGWDSRFVADPWLIRRDWGWEMHYYGFDGRRACDGVAVSTDLLHWRKHPRPLLTPGPPGSYDAKYAHKPCVVERAGTIYHFYCAVDEHHYRAIALATSP
ncbi:MAG TPA: hypothetical protein VF234_01255 [Limnochordia bacterium]